MGAKGVNRSSSVKLLAAWLIDYVESWLNLLVPRKSNIFLEDNFAPVPEGSLESDLEVTGTLPACLNGEFVRTGPNPRFSPTRGYHWFDGDGMLHGVRIKDGRASYVNRYVRTAKLEQEEKFGKPVFIKLGDMGGYVGLMKLLLGELRTYLGIIDVSNGAGTGNTALVYHNRSLLALHEGDAPYVIQVIADGQLETLGRLTYEGRLNHAFTAHPKVDPATGEMFTFGYDLKKSIAQYHVVSASGVMGPGVTIHLPRPIMMHDFAITEKYAVFMDLPLVFTPEALVKTGFPFKFDKSVKARYGLLPRYASSESVMQWFELPNHFVFHTANAWEEGDEVVLLVCRFPDMDLTKVDVEGVDEHAQSLYEIRFNTKTGKATETELATVRCDFPRINEAFVGRKQRYVYCAVMKAARILGVAKFDLTVAPDLQEGKGPNVGGTFVAYFSHGPSRAGSEAVFVPRDVDGSKGYAEDDGYLLNYVHDEATNTSEMVVIDAKTMSAEPVAVVKLPRRVPYGFHGMFVSEEQIKQQKNVLSQEKADGASVNGDMNAPLLA